MSLLGASAHDLLNQHCESIPFTPGTLICVVLRKKLCELCPYLLWLFLHGGGLLRWLGALLVYSLQLSTQTH